MTENTWNKNSESFLKDIESKCFTFANTHLIIAKKSKTTCEQLSLASMIITPMSGLITSLSLMIITPYSFVFEILSILCSVVASIIATILKFKNYNEITSNSRLIAAQYISLENNISRQLILDRNHRLDSSSYIDWVGKSFDDIFSKDTSFNTIDKLYSPTSECYNKSNHNSPTRQLSPIKEQDVELGKLRRGSNALSFESGLNKFNDSVMRKDCRY